MAKGCPAKLRFLCDRPDGHEGDHCNIADGAWTENQKGFPTEGYEVATWVPAGESDPTQIHLILPIPGGHAVMRIKSRDALDTLVITLLKYREDVFGKDN